MLKQNYYMHNENSNVTIIGDISGMTGSPVTSNIGDITTMKKMSKHSIKYDCQFD